MSHKPEKSPTTAPEKATSSQGEAPSAQVAPPPPPPIILPFPLPVLPLRGNEPDPVNKRLGLVVPSLLNPPFALPVRLSHWAPDEVVQPDGTVNVIYPEEALKVYEEGGFKKRHPFQPPLLGDERTWITGTENWLRMDTAQTKEFNVWLTDLFPLIRMYNRALYQLRAHHLESEGKGKMQDLPLFDPKSEGPDERNFINRVNELRNHLNAEFGTEKQVVTVDMVQVNSYIVSVRAIFKPYDGLGPKRKDGSETTRCPQPGGSESSHIYISSPFASH